MNTKEKLMEKITDKVIKVMEDTHKNIIGEDGLTVWDFAELRDAFITLLTSEVERTGDKVEQVIAELIQTHDCANDTACKFEDRLVKAQAKIGRIFRQRKALSELQVKKKV